MKNCKTCRKQNCEYRGKAYKNMTITCSQVCVAELKKECDTIATEEFRNIIGSLKNGNYQNMIFDTKEDALSKIGVDGYES